MKSIDYHITYSLEEINKTAIQLAASGILEYPVITFVGDLGSGKTTLIQELGKLMGVEANISSPTFSIVNEYSGRRGPVYHIDLYRLKNEEEALEIGIEEYLYGTGICLIEWPQIIEGICPYPHIRIEIENLGKFTRSLHVKELSEPI